VLTFIAFFYTCANPFIYAVKFEPVKRILIGLVPCKVSRPADGGAGVRDTATTASSRVQKRN